LSVQVLVKYISAYMSCVERQKMMMAKKVTKSEEVIAKV